MNAVRIGMALMLLLTGIASAGEVYRWVDHGGVTNYSDEPPPPGIASQLQQRPLTSSVVESQTTAQVRKAMARNPVLLYAGGCGDLCDQARALLDKRGVPYTERDPQGSKDDEKALVALAGKPLLPVLKVGDKVLKGFLADSWNKALTTAGYPEGPVHVKPHLTPPAPVKPAPVAASPDAYPLPDVPENPVESR